MRLLPVSVALIVAFAAAAQEETRGAAIRRLLDTAHSSEAETAARAWIAELEGQGHSDSLEFATALDLLADALTTASSPLAEIQALADRSIALKTKLLGETNDSLAETFNITGLRKFRGGDYSGSIDDFLHAQKIEELPANHSSPFLVSTTLNGLGLAFGAKGDPKHALELHQRALAIREGEFGKEDWRTADILFSMATDYRQLGDVVRSMEFSQRSVDIFGRTNPNHPAAGMAVGSLASAYRESAQEGKARPLFEKAIEIFTRNFGPDSPRLVASYNNYGLCLKGLSDFGAARLAFQQAVRISTKANGPKSSITAQTLGNYGIMLQEDGDYTAAREAYEGALAILQERLGPEHDGTAAVLTSLGLLLRDMGDLRAAHPYIERALAIYTKRFGPENPKTLQVAGDLASIYNHEKNYKAARPLVESTLAAYRKTLGPDNVKTGGQLSELGDILANTGDLPQAIDLYRQSIAIFDSKIGVDSYGAAEGRALLSELQMNAGDYAGAKESARQAVASFKKLFGPDYHLLGGPLSILAEAEMNLSDTQAAFEHAMEAARVRRLNLLAVSRTASERQALLFAGQGGDGLDVALRMAAAGLPSESRAAVWDAVIRDRALVLDEMAERQRQANESADPELAALNRGLMSAREELAHSVIAGPRAREKSYTERVERLRASLETRERQLAVKSTDFRIRLNRQRAGLKEVLESLPAASALAAYVRYSKGYLAFVIRSGETSPAVVPLGTTQQVEALFQRWREQIDREREFQGREAVKNETSYRAAGSALRRAVWDPVAKLLPGVEHLYLTADGVLQLVNFAALPVGSASYLMESGPLLHVLSAERDLRRAGARQSGGGQMLALGRPAFDSKPDGNIAAANVYRGARSGCQAFSSLDFADLPGSALEAQSVLNIWKARGNTGVALTGDRATESAFKEMAAGKRVIHIATHGFFLATGCESQTSEDPLLRSGLALAGANRRATAIASQDDGILTAEEVASLDLSSAELVVLSGCDTGSGEVRDGEGVLGLRRAFQVAGAGNMIMSLWPVTDEGTREWMTSLYRARFANRHSTAASVREASLAQLRARRAAKQSTHPFYWAGFISVGEN